MQQNIALRTTTGCTKTTSIDHIDPETKTLKIRDHIDLKGAKYYDRIKTNTSHPIYNTQKNLVNIPESGLQRVPDSVKDPNSLRILNTKLTISQKQKLQQSEN